MMALPEIKTAANSGAIPPVEPVPGERIAKVLARAGVASRRDAEAMILAGRVMVDGAVLTSPALNVTPDNQISVDGQPLAKAESTRLWLYYKPLGLVTTHKDPEGRATVFASLPPTMPRVISVGRLDVNSEGLLLLTNDGALARRLELPSNGWVRRYRVRVFGTPTADAFAKLMAGVNIDGVQYGSIKADLDRQQGSNAWLNLSLREGKNREIRVVMEHLGFQVSRLIRTAYGPFQLGTMVEGELREVTGKVLAEQLGGTPSNPDGSGRTRRIEQKNAHRRR